MNVFKLVFIKFTIYLCLIIQITSRHWHYKLEILEISLSSNRRDHWYVCIFLFRIYPINYLLHLLCNQGTYIADFRILKWYWDYLKNMFFNFTDYLNFIKFYTLGVKKIARLIRSLSKNMLKHYLESVNNFGYH